MLLPSHYSHMRGPLLRANISQNHDRCNIVPAPPASAVCHKSAESVPPSLYTHAHCSAWNSLKCDPILNNNRPTLLPPTAPQTQTQRFRSVIVVPSLLLQDLPRQWSLAHPSVITENRIKIKSFHFMSVQPTPECGPP